jgi:pimeloyl-ACP methyl ester carboxylesterase
MGVSAGGASALQTAIRHPERARVLVHFVPIPWKPGGVTDSTPPGLIRTLGLRGGARLGESLRRAALEAVRVPVLAIGACDDGFGICVGAEDSASREADPKLVGLDGGGHRPVGREAQVQAAVFALTVPAGPP